MRKAVVGQQPDRPSPARRTVDARRPDAVLLRQLPGRDGGPHRLRRRGVERREVHHGAGVQDPPEVREPAFGGGAGDEIERSAVDRDERDARRPLAPAQIDVASYGRASSGSAACHAGRSGAATEPERDDHEQRRPRHAARAPGARGERAITDEQRGRAATSEPLAWRARFGLEHEREGATLAHISAAPPAAAGAQPRQHADADPGRRERSRARSWRTHEQDVEGDREVDRIEEADRRDEAARSLTRMQRQRRIELQHERRARTRGQRRGEDRVAQHPQVAHGLDSVYWPDALRRRQRK